MDLGQARFREERSGGEKLLLIHRGYGLGQGVIAPDIGEIEIKR